MVWQFKYLFFSLLAACASRWPAVVDVRDVADSQSAPSVSRVTDIGAGRIVAHGPLPIVGGAPDGVASIGELLLVQGNHFGRQPTVRVAELPATIEGFTVGGGVVVRVPAAAATGTQTIVVENAAGRANASIRIRRFGLFGAVGRVQPFEVDSDGLHAVGSPIALADVRFVGFSLDGSVGYAVGGRTIVAIDMGASGGPREIVRRDLGVSGFVDFDLSMRAPLAAGVTADHFVLVDLSRPRNPARFQPKPLPESVVEPVAIAVDQEAKRVALVSAKTNAVTLVDISDPLRPAVADTLLPLSDSALPALCDAKFGVDGTLWVIAGDSARSLRLGKQESRLLAINAAGTRVFALGRDRAPFAMVLPRQSLWQSGSAIRPRREGLVIGWAASDELFGDKPPNAEVTWFEPEGSDTPLFGGPFVLGAIDLAEEGRLAVAAATRRETAGLLWARRDRQTKGFVEIVTAGAGASSTAVAIQP